MQMMRQTSARQCAELLRNFLDSRSQGASLMKTWFQYFDKKYRGRINRIQFTSGMKALQYPNDIDGLWDEMDHEQMDELYFEDIDHDQAQVWTTFRRWCGATFEGPRDMIACIKGTHAHDAHIMESPRGHKAPPPEVVTLSEAREGLVLCGWDGGHEDLLVAAMDNDDGVLSAAHIPWLDAEVQRHRQRLAAKRKGLQASKRLVKGVRAGQQALTHFRGFLRQRYGRHLFRAWRKVLDCDGSRRVSSSRLFMPLDGLEMPRRCGELLIKMEEVSPA